MLPEENRQKTIQHIIDGLQWDGKTFAISAIREKVLNNYVIH